MVVSGPPAGESAAVSSYGKHVGHPRVLETAPATESTVRVERAHELRSHLGHLDALRGIAVVGVISHHTGISIPNVLTPYINVPGVRGVQLFFVLSAFTLLLSAQRRSTDTHPKLFFFLRRIFRLGPLYYLILLVTLLVEPVERLHWGAKWPSLLFLQNLLPKNYSAGPHLGWSLSVEALFYLCFPFLQRWINSLRTALVWLAVAIPVTSLAWWTLATWIPADGDYWSYNSFLVQFPVFLIGFACFYLWRDYLSGMEGQEQGKWISVAFLILTGLIFAAVVPIDSRKVLCSSLFVVPFMLALSTYSWRLFVNRVTIFLGKVSYGIYLIHGLLISLTQNHVQSMFYRHFSHNLYLLWWFLYFAAITALSTGLATLMWFWVEEPGIRLGRRLLRYLQHKPPTDGGLLLPPRAVLTTTNSPDAQF